MDEREFFDEKPEKKPATLNCPHCHQSAEYDVTWLVRTLVERDWNGVLTLEVFAEGALLESLALVRAVLDDGA